MTNDERSPNLEIRNGETDLLAFHLIFGFRDSFDIGHSDFVIILFVRFPVRATLPACST